MCPKNAGKHLCIATYLRKGKAIIKLREVIASGKVKIKIYTRR